MTEQIKQPKIGNIVLFVPDLAGLPEICPAIITVVHDPLIINLIIFADSTIIDGTRWGIHRGVRVKYSEERKPGTWHWIAQ